jgi:hypothetical protein
MVIDDDIIGEEEFFSQKAKNDDNVEMNKEQFMKDNPFTIFHALGKFLYNKSKSVQILILAV